jgi:hypothetical protein
MGRRPDIGVATTTKSQDAAKWASDANGMSLNAKAVGSVTPGR